MSRAAPSAVPRSLAARAVRLVTSLAVPLAAFLVLRAFVVEAFHIWPSGSMERTLLIGDFLFVNKALYGAEIPVVHKRLPAFRQPTRRDVVVFQSVEDADLTVVKRIVGAAGDTLAMRDNVLFRNGRVMDEPYINRRDSGRDDPSDPRMRAWQLRHYAGRSPRTYHPTLKNWGPLVVPADSFFVMGDNRNDSYDSRYWGFLGRDRIRGSPFLVYFSYDRNGRLPLPIVTAIRWDRLLTVPH
jgi:signal peptidase I